MSYQMVDFHSHTRHSDGELTVAELLDFAQDKGVEVFSITDHDSIAAYNEIPTTCPMKIIPGVEISCQLEGKELHLVAMAVDPTNTALKALLEQNQKARNQRAEWIIARLQKIGLPDISETLSRQVTGEVICRTHLAKALVELDIAKDFQAAFKRFLGRSGKVWRRADWPAMQTVIDTVHAAGGAVILAHPTKYRYSSTKISEIVQVFAEQGGDALEVNYSGLNLNHKSWLKRLAKTHQLQASVGSDFHHLKQTWAIPGRFSQIDPELTPVWEQFMV